MQTRQGYYSHRGSHIYGLPIDRPTKICDLERQIDRDFALFHRNWTFGRPNRKLLRSCAAQLLWNFDIFRNRTILAVELNLPQLGLLLLVLRRLACKLRLQYLIMILSARLTLLERAIANGRSVCPSVRLFVRLSATLVNHAGLSTSTRFKISKYISHRTIQRCF